jgi:hypothetical protein
VRDKIDESGDTTPPATSAAIAAQRHPPTKVEGSAHNLDVLDDENDLFNMTARMLAPA